MTLAAAQVIDAIATRITGLSIAGSNVYTSRAWPLTEALLPAWRVVAGDEDVEPQTVHPNLLQQHTLQVELRGHAKATSDLDDALHALAEEVLTAVFRARVVTDPMAIPPTVADALDNLYGKLQVSLRRIERVLQEEGEAVLGLIVVTLRVIFRTRASAPGTLV